MKLKTLYLTTLVLLVLVSLPTVYVAGASSDSFTLSQGIYPSADDYTLFKEGATYYAKSAYGVISYLSTNFSYVWNEIAGSGVSVHIHGDTYTYTHPLLYDTCMTIEGEGSHNTLLRYTGDDWAFKPVKIGTGINAVRDVVMRDFKIEGNYLTTQLGGINMTGVHSSTLENVWVIGFYKSGAIGILLDGNNAGTYCPCLYNDFYEVFVTGIDNGTCLKLDGVDGNGQSNQNNFYGGRFDDGQIGVEIVSGENNAFFGSAIEGFRDTGIMLWDDADFSNFYGVWIESTQDNVVGVNITSGCYYVHLIDPYIYLSGSGTTRIDNSASAYLFTHWGYVHIGMSHPTTTGWGSFEEGRIWYCTTHHCVEYWNGTDIISVP